VSAAYGISDLQDMPEEMTDLLCLAQMLPLGCSSGSTCTWPYHWRLVLRALQWCDSCCAGQMLWLQGIFVTCRCCCRHFLLAGLLRNKEQCS
jgi:hypothetical protein